MATTPENQEHEDNQRREEIPDAGALPFPGPDPGNSVPIHLRSEFDLESFGENFTIVEDKPKKKRRRKAYARFLHGKSRFVFYRITVRFAPPKIKKPRAVNAEVKVSPKEKQALETRILKSKSRLARLFEQRLLPVTLSILSCADDTKDRFSQMIDDQVDLPIEFMMKKAQQAVRLSIIDELASMFELTEKNTSLLKAEFLKLPEQSQPSQFK